MGTTGHPSQPGRATHSHRMADKESVMKHVRSTSWLTAALSVVAFLTCVPMVAHAADPPPACTPGAEGPGSVRFTVDPVVPDDIGKSMVLTDKKDKRAAATFATSDCLDLGFPDLCGRRDFGQKFHPRLFAYLASSDPAKKQAAYDFLKNIQR